MTSCPQGSGMQDLRIWLQNPCWIRLWTLVIAVSFLPATWSFCPAQCQCDDYSLETVCVSAKLDVVPNLLNPALKSLTLSHNKISTIRQSLEFYADLEHLDLSFNTIATLGQRNLETQKLLRTLNVSHNTVIELENETFKGLAHLQTLDLSHNELFQLSDHIFSDLRTLVELDLSWNKLNYIADRSFVHLRHLRYLKLNSNRLQSVPGHSFQSLAVLNFLDLSGNSIAQLDGDSLGRLTELRDLNVSNNEIHHIHYAAFRGLDSLQLLDLSWNRLENVPTTSLEALQSVRFLDLSANYFSQVAHDAFTALHQVETLRLSHISTLRYFHKDSLNPMNSSLHTLIMSHNKDWATFSSKTFSSLKRLKYCDLSHNAFEGLPPVLWPVGVEYIDLSGNPVVCNCSVHWLWQMYSSSNQTFPSKDILCHGPEHVKDRYLFELDESEVLCFSAGYIILVSIVVVVVVMIGAAVAVLCCWKKQHSRRPPLKHLPHTIQHMDNSFQKNNKAALTLPKTVDYYLSDDDYVYHTAGSVKPVPVTAV